MNDRADTDTMEHLRKILHAEKRHVKPGKGLKAINGHLNPNTRGSLKRTRSNNCVWYFTVGVHRT